MKQANRNRSKRRKENRRLLRHESLESRRMLVATVTVTVGMPSSVGESAVEQIVYTLSRDETAETLAVEFELSGTARYLDDYSVREGDSDTVFVPSVAPQSGPVVGNAVFYPGESTVELIVRPKIDAIVEPDEFVIVSVVQADPFGPVLGATALISSGQDTEYYVVDGQNRFGSVDVETGVVTVLGQIDAAQTVFDIAYIEDGTLFAITTDYLYEVDPNDVTGGVIATRFLGAHNIEGANALVAARDGDFGSESGDLLAVGTGALTLQGIDLEHGGGQWNLSNVISLFNIEAALASQLLPSNFVSSGDLDYLSDDSLILSAAGFDEFSSPDPYDSLIEIRTPGTNALIDHAPQPAQDPGEDFHEIFGLAFDGNASYAFANYVMLRVNPFSRVSSRELEITGRDYQVGTASSATGTILGATSQDRIGLYQGDVSLFHLNEDFTPGLADIYFAFGPGGGAGWTPLAGDWNGDGVDTIGLYQPNISLFHLKDSFTPGASDQYFAFGPGSAGWIPLSGDWNGDGIDTIGLYQPDISLFHLKDSFTPGASDHYFAFGPGGAGWIPVVGDWDGDGADSVGLYQPDISLFHLKDSFTPGASDYYFAFGPGGAGWIPMSGDWDGDGRDTIGLYQPDISLFHLKDSFTAGASDHYFAFGPGGAGWLPLSGDWNGPATPPPPPAARGLTLTVDPSADGEQTNDEPSEAFGIVRNASTLPVKFVGTTDNADRQSADSSQDRMTPDGIDAESVETLSREASRLLTRDLALADW